MPADPAAASLAFLIVVGSRPPEPPEPPGPADQPSSGDAPPSADRPRRLVRVTTRAGTRSEGAPPVDQAELVALAKEGDHAAFEELVRVTYQDTYTLALRLTGDEEDARDVVQETYLRAYRGLRRFRGDSAFSTWLYRITANCSSNQLRRRVRHRHDDLDDVPAPVERDPALDPVGRADAAELKDRIEEALLELPAKLRAVVILRDVYDLSHQAIAEELGITESAAKVRLHRARRKLKERLYPTRAASPSAGEDATDEVDRHAV